MNRNEFIKLLPTEEEKAKLAIKGTYEGDIFLGAIAWLTDYLTAKFPDFTEDEMKAIEMYRTTPLAAVNYLRNTSDRTFKEANEFLQQNQ